MASPDGAEYDNVYLFEDVEVGERVTYVHQGSEEHGLAPSRSDMVIDRVDAERPQKRVTLPALYASEADRRRHLDD